MRQIVFFSFVGIIGFAVDATLTYLFASTLQLFPIYAKLLAFPFAVTVTWFCNRKLTFSSGNNNLLSEWASFLRVSLGGALLNNLSFYLVIRYSIFFEDHLVFAVAVGAIVGMVFNFIGSRFYVFR